MHMTQQSPPGDDRPKRRVRYKGKNPRSFAQKYKERNPDLYAEDIEKIKARGATPAGSHRSIMIEEILQILSPAPGEVALDATVGYGGHASEILKRLAPGGTLYAFDTDPIELPKTQARLAALEIPNVHLVTFQKNFSEIASCMKDVKVDVLLADLGVSSMQLDNPERGFSLKEEGPLDLRMNPHKGESAAELLARLSVEELTHLLELNADETHAKRIAQTICELKKKNPILTTLNLVEVGRKAIKRLSPSAQEREGDTPIRRLFQALRIAVNGELDALDQLLEDLPERLAPGGRVAILSFHSGEDRRVKKAFQAGLRSGLFKEASDELLRPTLDEQRQNPRSTSAKLRWAVRA
jgi:16S rRNA (cytosine1402-N4)-methyltransferase